MFRPTSLTQTDQNILLAKVVYDIYSTTPTQTFSVPKLFTDLGITTRFVTFRVLSNWGSDITCIYRVRAVLPRLAQLCPEFPSIPHSFNRVSPCLSVADMPYRFECMAHTGRLRPRSRLQTTPESVFGCVLEGEGVLAVGGVARQARVGDLVTRSRPQRATTSSGEPRAIERAERDE